MNSFPDSSGRFRNWADTFEFDPRSLERPKSLSDIVDLVQGAERSGRIIRPAGHGCSFTKLIMSQDVFVSTDDLDQVFEVHGPGLTFPVGGNRLKLPLRASLEQLGIEGLIYTEAGIKIRKIFDFLRDGFVQGSLEMPTVGGAQMQSLAGAFSTGTHGADLNLPPLADFVRALHLVGSGGQQYWIEPTGDRQITDPRLLARELPDVDIIYDDDVFDSAIVSMGRFGIIYSVVYELKNATMTERLLDSLPWSTVSSRMISAGSNFASFVRSMHSPGSTRIERSGQLPMEHLTLTMSLGGDGICYQARHWRTNSRTIIKKTGPNQLYLLGRWLFVPMYSMLIGYAQHLQSGNVKPVADLPDLLRRELSNGVMAFFLTGHRAIDATEAIVSEPDLPFHEVDSAEYALSARSPRVIVSFVNAILSLASSPQMGGWVSLRFTQGTKSLLGMQQFPVTAHVEIAVVQIAGQSAPFLEAVDRLASRLGVRVFPHWGQRHSRRENEYRRLFGNAKYRRWRKSLRRVTRKGKPSTFSNYFTDNAGLNPERSRQTSPFPLFP